MNVPKNISILTWNYDFQIERSIINEFKISDYSNHFSFFPNNRNDLKSTYDENKLNIIKLNGTSGIFLRKNDSEPSVQELMSIYEMTEEEHMNKRLAEIINGYYNGRQFNSMIDFAWENENPITQANRKLAIEVAKRTDFLIVVGYSFPFFNREIDTVLLEQMYNTGKLKGIYLQVGDNSDSVKTRIISINKNFENKIKIINDLEQFYLPDELEYTPFVFRSSVIKNKRYSL